MLSKSLYALLLLVSLAGTVRADVVTFEDATPYSSAALLVPFSGFVWQGFGVIDQTDYFGTELANRAGSGDFYAYNLSGERRVRFWTESGDFIQLNSGQFSSRIDTPINMYFAGRVKSGGWIGKLVEVGPSMQDVVFNWEIDKMEIFVTSQMGASYSGDPTMFFMDNLIFNQNQSIPEPSTAWLVLATIISLLAARKRFPHDAGRFPRSI